MAKDKSKDDTKAVAVVGLRGKDVEKRRKAVGKGRLLDERAIVRIERRFQVLQMRRDGHTMQEIAETLHMEPPLVREILHDILSNTIAATEESMEEARRLEIQRYDGLLKFYYTLAIAGNLAATAVVLQVSAQRRKLLALDVPETKNINLTGVREYIGVNMEDV